MCNVWMQTSSPCRGTENAICTRLNARNANQVHVALNQLKLLNIIKNDRILSSCHPGASTTSLPAVSTTPKSVAPSPIPIPPP